jgi:murein DD-endopeptidase MepM/ murein hydrolase activator NlpD
MPEDVVMPEIPHRGHSFLRFRRRYLAFGAMAFAGIMTGMPTLPASAEVIHAEAAQVGLQTMRASLVEALPVVERGDFTISYYSVVQSPVAPGTTISSGFGGRIPPCDGCSSYHEGVDFLPGFGTPVLAIADGVVVATGNPSGSLGVFVSVQHEIDGQTVTSTYAHMGYGSMNLSVGDTIARGQVVGTVGSTGQSTGPHLYFEIRLANGAAVNPVPWLAAHVNI